MPTRLRVLFASSLVAALAAPLCARAQTLVFDGEVPTTDGVTFFSIPFEVPAGIAELEIRHDDLSTTNILDWGLLSPSGFRGYGGGNTENAVLNADAASRSYLPGAIEPGTWEVYVGEANVEELPARYHVEVELRAVATLAPQPERAPYSAATPLSIETRFYAGDFHVHTRESGDATPTLDEVATFAESVGLDFVMLSDHNTVSQLELIQDAQSRHPTVLLIPGIEVSTYEGHFMSLGGTTWIDHRLGVGGLTLDDVAMNVHADGALFTVNHPALDIGNLCIGCAWSASVAPSSVDGIEVQTGAFSVTGRLFFATVVDRWEELVLMGEHVVAIGGSDDHRAGTGTGSFDSPIGSPTTMVLADELSVAGILAGVRSGRTVVRLEGPDDPMLELSSAELADGSDTITADRTTLVLRVTGAELGTGLRLVRDGAVLPAMDVVGTDATLEIPVLAGPSQSAIRAEVLVGGRVRVVTSHVFLVPVTPGGPDAGPVDGGTPDASGAAAAPPSSCGCHAVGAGSPAASAARLVGLVVMGVLGRRRARRPGRLGARRYVSTGFQCQSTAAPATVPIS